MKNNEKQIVYHGKVNVDDWSISIAITDKGICFVGSDGGGLKEVKSWFEKNKPNVMFIESIDKITRYGTQLVEYMNGARKVFDLPLDLVGTTFQQAVWNELQMIPYGKTNTYTDIAKKHWQTYCRSCCCNSNRCKPNFNCCSVSPSHP